MTGTAHRYMIEAVVSRPVQYSLHVQHVQLLKLDSSSKPSASCKTIITSCVFGMVKLHFIWTLWTQFV